MISSAFFVNLLAFLVTIAVVILVHEYGHYRVAVACGVKVDRFSVGFGNVIWRRQPTPGGTEFVISAFPLGGYVRWIDDREGGVQPSERHQTFKSKSLLQRTAIVAAGPLANFALAVVLVAVANWIGVDEPQALMASPTPGSLAERAGIQPGELVRRVSRDGGEWRDVRSMADVSWELAQAVSHGEPLSLSLSSPRGHGERTVVLPIQDLPSHELDAATIRSIGLGLAFSEPVVSTPMPGGPAAKAGILAGDRVLSVDGKPIADAAGLIDIIRASAASGEPPLMTWRVERAGQVRELSVQPASRQEGASRVGYVDMRIGARPPTVLVRYGFFEGMAQGVTRTWESSGMTFRILGKMLIGQASLKNLSGPITIAEYAGQTAQMGLAFFIGFLAVISTSIGALNLLPLPFLDGGHLMYYLFEAVTGRPLSEQWFERLQRAGLVLVLLMMSLALYNDVARQLGQH
ncbi:RIP metalloprotease RseP [Piscinibacter terrae]|uniref:Zinc metalloprotease n=1 Tax=Piscinibacter terrae TaxID=2496871 RepID=A0A3N7JRD7_9BURK|nr:RIP metalloprotease RseP [Albitalea terrae]RQP23569.1 RIP metalloprotease RseP [Albitalea terrae]